MQVERAGPDSQELVVRFSGNVRLTMVPETD